MKIVLNGESLEVEASTLEALLRERAIEGRVATAVNESFVPKGMRASTELSDGDRIEILAPMQGG